MSLLQSLKQPFPYDPCTRNKVGMAAFFGVFIFIFLMIFKPFELDQFDTQRLLFIAFVYGAITFACVLTATSLLPLIFPQTFNENSWTTGKQIIFTAGVIFLVGIVNYLVSPLLVDTRLTLRDAVWFQGITLAIGILPVSIFILLRQNRLLKKFREDAALLEKKLQEKHEEKKMKIAPEPGLSNRVSLAGDYQDERLELFVDDIHLITSASNYIKIFHLQKEKLVYSVIRSTLKKTEEIIFPYSNLFKCHRAYIINLDKVMHVEGNAQGYKLKIDNYEELIPVSRNLSTEFSDKLLAFRKSLKIEN